MGVRFATGNMDLQEDTANGQGSFYGTAIVTFQVDGPGEPINSPIAIAEKIIKSELLQLRTEYLPEIQIKSTNPSLYDLTASHSDQESSSKILMISLAHGP